MRWAGRICNWRGCPKPSTPSWLRCREGALTVRCNPTRWPSTKRRTAYAVMGSGAGVQRGGHPMSSRPAAQNGAYRRVRDVRRLRVGIIAPASDQGQRASTRPSGPVQNGGLARVRLLYRLTAGGYCCAARNRWDAEANRHYQPQRGSEGRGQPALNRYRICVGCSDPTEHALVGFAVLRGVAAVTPVRRLLRRPAGPDGSVLAFWCSERCASSAAQAGRGSKRRRHRTIS